MPRPCVVTLGGGHGQAALLAGLRQLRCSITAVVSVADDGGCSGRLRDELQMAPPGDIRRCLIALARDRELAARFEVRLRRLDDTAPLSVQRSAGNLAIAEAYVELGSLQAAVDWAADVLQIEGRVVPVAEVAGELAVYDQLGGEVAGETAVTAASTQPVVAVVRGPDGANPEAVRAIAEADFIFMGPGSFITSTLATLTTAGVAQAIAGSSAMRVLVHNLRVEGEPTAGLGLPDYVRLLRDHIEIGSGTHDIDFAVLCHRDANTLSRERLGAGTVALSAQLARPGHNVHDPDLVAYALAHHLGFEREEPGCVSPMAPTQPARASFEERLGRARARLAARQSDERSAE